MLDLETARARWHDMTRTWVAPWVSRHSTHHADCGCLSKAAAEYIAALEAECEALKCCGNCKNLSAGQQECDWDGDAITDWSASCRITPSRWTGRTDG